MTDSAMLSFTLRRLRASVVLLAPFVKLQKKFLRQVLTIFGGADKAPRLQALLFLRQMAAMLPPPALELALKVSLPVAWDLVQVPQSALHHLPLRCMAYLHPVFSMLVKGILRLDCDWVVHSCNLQTVLLLFFLIR